MLVEGLKKSCLAVEKLKLKIGAEVMFIKNDTTGRYVNGIRKLYDISSQKQCDFQVEGAETTTESVTNICNYSFSEDTFKRARRAAAG